MTTLALHGVTRDYRSRRILSDVRLELGPGLWLLAGPNGSGKSTLLSLIAGEAVPSRGRITLDGRLQGRAQLWRAVSYARTRIDLDPKATAGEALCVRLGLSGHSQQAARRLLAPWLSHFRAEDLARAQVGTLSQGQAQRLALAGVFARPAQVLLADEPLRALDSEGQAQCVKALQQLAEDRPVIVASHMLDTFLSAGAQALLLSEGRVLAGEASARWLSAYAQQRAWVQLNTDRPREVAAALATETGVGVLWLSDGSLRIECADAQALSRSLLALPGTLRASLTRFSRGATHLDTLMKRLPASLEGAS